MFEIKLSQGAKPGKGGILPGVKVTREIAAIRGIAVGEDSISPTGHPEINSNDELLDFIERVKQITRKPVGLKTVVGASAGLTTLCRRSKSAVFRPTSSRWTPATGAQGPRPWR